MRNEKMSRDLMVPKETQIFKEVTGGMEPSRFNIQEQKKLLRQIKHCPRDNDDFSKLVERLKEAARKR